MLGPCILSVFFPNKWRSCDVLRISSILLLLSAMKLQVALCLLLFAFACFAYLRNLQDWLDFNWNDPQVSCRCPICLPYHVLCVSQGLALFSVSPAMSQASGCCDCRIWSPNFSSLFAPRLPEVQSVSAYHLPVACLSSRRVREQAFAWPPSVSLLPDVCDACAAEQKLAFNISQLFLLSSSCDGIKVDLSGGSQCVCVFNDVYPELYFLQEDSVVTSTRSWRCVNLTRLLGKPPLRSVTFMMKKVD